MDRSNDKIGYEISFNKIFYKFKPLRNSTTIKQELIDLDQEINKELKDL